MKEIYCLECGSLIVQKYDSRVPKFCNMLCYNRHKKHPKIGRFINQCVICNAVFNSVKKSIKVCSSDCNRLYIPLASKNKKKKYSTIRKKAILNLLGNCCLNCGFNGGPRSLCFHHLKPEIKRFNLTTTNMMNYSYKTILEEIKFCILLCHNCHSILHEAIDSLDRKQIYEYNRYKARKIDIINKSNNVCVKCGLLYSGFLSVFSFHHLDKSTKLFDLSRYNLVHKNILEIENELKKCSMMCINCHMIEENNLLV